MVPQENITGNEYSNKISEILKRTNQLIKEGKLDSAQGELIRANLEAKERYYKNLSSGQKKEKFDTSTNMPLEPSLTPIETLMNKIISTPQKESKASIIDSEIKTGHLNDKNTANKQRNRKVEYDYYREALKSMWMDGPLSQEEKKQLEELKLVLEITEPEHQTLEKEAKLICYKDALQQFLLSGISPVKGAKTIVAIREAFGITKAEHEEIQKKYFTKAKESREKILLIDDDKQFLEAISALLIEGGFQVTAVDNADEAYSILQKYTPDLILCDIKLENSSMDGLAFFKKIQLDKRIRQIPFIFVTGYSDENIARAGRELGVDDFITKPVSKNVLISLVRGKIKRFKQLFNQ